MPTKVTATELARNLSDVLSRVRYQGEEFLIERNGEPIATLAPLPQRPRMTLAEAVEALNQLGWPDEDFANDLEEIHNSQGEVQFRDWPS